MAALHLGPPRLQQRDQRAGVGRALFGQRLERREVAARDHERGEKGGAVVFEQADVVFAGVGERPLHGRLALIEAPRDEDRKGMEPQ